LPPNRLARFGTLMDFWPTVAT